MHKLEFTLKQHTPIIHFQHNHNGATLRATEVKPKLDRFITEKILAEGKKIPNEWLIDEHKALNYKMSFFTETVIKEKINNNKNSPMYFGNMGKTEEKHLILADSISGKIIAKNKDLIDYIHKNITQFFFLNNFGTRQNKGYGSFTVAHINNDSVKDNYHTKYHFTLNTSDWHVALSKLDLFYRALRSGINIGKIKYNDSVSNNPNVIKQQDFETKFYLKPVIFCYAKDVLNQQWDKKSIKEKFFGNEYYYRKASRKEYEIIKARIDSKKARIETLGLKKQIEKHNNPDILIYQSENKTSVYYDFRDLFGLSSNEKWYSYDASIQKSINDIDRFPSPIVFKPIMISNQYRIFIHLSTINDEYLNKDVTIINNDKTLTLKIPNNKNFMQEFFDYIVTKYTFEVNKEYRDFSVNSINYFDTLKDIFTQLKNNANNS